MAEHLLKRKAQVGEIVEIVSVHSSCTGKYQVGQRKQVNRVPSNGEGVYVLNNNKNQYVLDWEYMVVVEVAEPQDETAKAIRELTAEVKELRGLISNLIQSIPSLLGVANVYKPALHGTGDKSINAINPESISTGASVTDKRVVPISISTPEAKRLAVVQRAEQLMKHLKYTARNDINLVSKYKNDNRMLQYLPNRDKIAFINNPVKGTVVALIKLGGTEVIARGEAVCMPDDTFNVVIGQTIALCRALGYGTPVFLTRDVPEANEPVVGDFICIKHGQYSGRQGYIVERSEHSSTIMFSSSEYGNPVTRSVVNSNIKLHVKPERKGRESRWKKIK